MVIFLLCHLSSKIPIPVPILAVFEAVADPGGGHGAMPPIITDFVSKIRFLMSFQIFLDSSIDSSNETITLIN